MMGFKVSLIVDAFPELKLERKRTNSLVNHLETFSSIWDEFSGEIINECAIFNVKQ
jgi:hypothetical protein